MTPLQLLALECEAARRAWHLDAGDMIKLDTYLNLCCRLSHYFVPEILASIPLVELERAT